jgi:photosystem II stability/assembly factor-like uncharacterized protein
MKTWKQTFSASTFYFNYVSCPSANVCYAAAENDNDGYIYVSNDGGESWQLKLTAPNTSMFAAHAISEEEAYLGGGVLSPLAINGTVYHTRDGGNTWDLTVIPGYYITSLSYVSNTAGFATAMNQMQQCNVLIYQGRNPEEKN